MKRSPSAMDSAGKWSEKACAYCLRALQLFWCLVLDLRGFTELFECEYFTHLKLAALLARCDARAADPPKQVAVQWLLWESEFLSQLFSSVRANDRPAARE